MSSDAISPAREAQLINELLRDRVGIDPEELRPVVDLAALGLVNSAWRNSPVEDWHADGRLGDADMLRINSHTTWRVRQRLDGWIAEAGLHADGPASDLDRVPAADVDRLAFRVFRWLVNPRRKLPTGMTLGELADGSLDDYENHADQALGSFAAQAELRGARFGFTRAAAHGGLACSHWWGHPHWPALVSRFLLAIDDQADEHWGADGQYKKELPPEPILVADRRLLRKTLHTRPWQLDSESAGWVILAGIGYLRHQA